jgi:hypothetical protein
MSCTEASIIGTKREDRNDKLIILVLVFIVKRAFRIIRVNIHWVQWHDPAPLWVDTILEF